MDPADLAERVDTTRLPVLDQDGLAIGLLLAAAVAALTTSRRRPGR